MLKATSSRETGTQVESSGPIKEQLNDLLNIIGAAYNGIRSRSDLLAWLFRELLIENIKDPEASVWQHRAEGVAIVVPAGEDRK